MTSCLTDDQVVQFNKDGVIVVRDFYRNKDILPIQNEIYEIIGFVMKKNGVDDKRASFDGQNFDEGFSVLIAENRSWGSEVYDAVKQIPAFHRLVAHPAHETIMRELRPGAHPGLAAGGYGIRIDNPGEDKFRALWHQEYPAQLRSLNGLVFWSPLIPITDDLGPVIVCPGSQVEGPLPVSVADSGKVSRTGAYALQIHNESQYINKYPHVAPLTSPGDLVIIDFLVLHASGFNRGRRSRWSMQFRYFDFAEPNGQKHGWSGSYAAGVDFRTIHPELFIG